MEDRGRDWFVGVDWAEWARAHDLRSRLGWHTEGSQTHRVFVIDAQGRKMGERGFDTRDRSSHPDDVWRVVHAIWFDQAHGGAGFCMAQA